MKYTPLTRMEKNPMTSAAKAAARAGHGERGQHAGLGLEGEGRHVAAEAEKSRVAERHQAGPPHEEVETHGEDSPDQDLLEDLDRIVAGQRGEQRGQREHARESQPGEPHFSGRPKSPWGRSRTTRAMTT